MKQIHGIVNLFRTGMVIRLQSILMTFIFFMKKDKKEVFSSVEKFGIEGTVITNAIII